MLGTAFIGSTLLVATALFQHWKLTADDYKDTCMKIEQTISLASQVFYSGKSSIILLVVPTSHNLYSSIGSPEFEADISHWAASSSQVSACSVRPGTPQDVGLIASAILTYFCHLINFSRRSFAYSP